MTRTKRKNQPIPHKPNVMRNQKVEAEFQVPKTFEELQLMQIKIMINKISGKLLENMHEKDADMNAMLPQFRIYAQYLNLYMKFKDKCLKDTDTTIPAQPKQPSTEIPKAPAKQKSPSHSEPKPNQPLNGNHNKIDQTMPNEWNKANNTSALLMQPPNST